MIQHIPLDITLNYSSLELVKESDNYIIFFGKNKIDLDVVIKIRTYDTKVFSGLGDEDGALLNYLKLYKKINKSSWAPKILANYISEENNITYVILVEKRYYQADYFGEDVIDKSQLLLDIEKVITELHKLGISHRDVALRNICFNHDTGHYILIDYNDAVDYIDLSIEEEMMTLRRELESINN